MPIVSPRYSVCAEWVRWIRRSHRLLRCRALRSVPNHLPAENVTCNFCVPENCDESIWFCSIRISNSLHLDGTEPTPSAPICTQIVDINKSARSQTHEWRMKIFHFHRAAPDNGLSLFHSVSRERFFFFLLKNTILLFFVVSGWYVLPPCFQWRAKNTKFTYSYVLRVASTRMLYCVLHWVSQNVIRAIEHVFISKAFRPVSFRVHEIIANKTYAIAMSVSVMRQVIFHNKCVYNRPMNTLSALLRSSKWISCAKCNEWDKEKKKIKRNRFSVMDERKL